ncbi:MAG TPA: BON domain-containing protein [Candidatus Acidoferrales bacterium]|nr:BON domain-containing protein [Candidatus Acidoferrales bacterium]
MRFLTAVLAFLLLVPAAAISAQAQNDHAIPQKGTRRYDQWLHQEVRHQLLLLPWYTVFDELGYSINGYTVTLTGEVVNPSLKSDAGNAVKHIEGVEKVINNIEVLPPSSMDDQIRREEYRKIYSAPSLFHYGVGNLQSIHIIVKNGHVTLVGYVDNQSDKNVAGIQANAVPGVFSVKNDLLVRNPK